MFKKIKYFIQRGRRGFSDEDLWDFSYYLSNTICEGIKEFRKDISGYPSSMTPEKWAETLASIEDGFKAALTISDRSLTVTGKDGKIEFNDELYADYMKRFNKAMDLFKKYYFGIWD